MPRSTIFENDRLGQAPKQLLKNVYTSAPMFATGIIMLNIHSGVLEELQGQIRPSAYESGKSISTHLFGSKR
ncbi:uncharacterized protein Bfra_002050 [Botrytis fragariae]|uniref:Uncharacterized protein n=1 Tax=Botrytis fragariae TaxID=1964551 RepID=A0A8H6EMI1_9HELO|nr:uncharacterized protein Bfra_002050 [Botrytis fragariae]KAF5877682.1 hypothetical protein Bfra_002050 [Botrytis fragariae]